MPTTLNILVMLQRILSWLRGERRALTLQNHPYLAVPPVSSGVSVSEHTALNLSAVWCATRVISEAVASLPLILYRRLGEGGKERATAHPLYVLLKDSPNPEMTSFVFREVLQSHLLLWGNAYAEIERDGSGRPIALWPIPPNRVQPGRREGQLVYRVQTDNGQTVELRPENVLHIPGLGFDGLVGYSPISLARESLGLTAACERFGSSFFGNAAKPGGVLEYPGQLSDQARENLRKSFEYIHSGASNTGRTLILEEGMKFTGTTIPPEDGQFLQTRQFQILEIARWFNLPPHRLKDLGRATWNNIESENISFIQDTLRPWLIKWEQEVSRKLLLPNERRTYFVEHLMDAYLRGDTESRFRVYVAGLNNGIFSINEVREMENKNPVEGGDKYMRPANLKDITEETPEPEPMSPDDQEQDEQDQNPGDQSQQDGDEGGQPDED